MTETITTNETHIWILIAIVGCAVIILLRILWLKVKQNHSKKNELKKKFGKGDFDFGDVIQSSFHAKELYSQLIRKCHPDRFVSDEKKRELAESLSQEITKNQNSYQKLLELKQQAEKELNIKINQ